MNDSLSNFTKTASYICQQIADLKAGKAYETMNDVYDHCFMISQGGDKFKSFFSIADYMSTYNDPTSDCLMIQDMRFSKIFASSVSKIGDKGTLKELYNQLQTDFFSKPNDINGGIRRLILGKPSSEAENLIASGAVWDPVRDYIDPVNGDKFTVFECLAFMGIYNKYMSKDSSYLKIPLVSYLTDDDGMLGIYLTMFSYLARIYECMNVYKNILLATKMYEHLSAIKDTPIGQKPIFPIKINGKYPGKGGEIQPFELLFYYLLSDSMALDDQLKKSMRPILDSFMKGVEVLISLTDMQLVINNAEAGTGLAGTVDSPIHPQCMRIMQMANKTRLKLSGLGDRNSLIIRTPYSFTAAAEKGISRPFFTAETNTNSFKTNIPKFYDYSYFWQLSNLKLDFYNNEIFNDIISHQKEIDNNFMSTPPKGNIPGIPTLPWHNQEMADLSTDKLKGQRQWWGETGYRITLPDNYSKQNVDGNSPAIMDANYHTLDVSFYESAYLPKEGHDYHDTFAVLELPVNLCEFSKIFAERKVYPYVIVDMPCFTRSFQDLLNNIGLSPSDYTDPKSFSPWRVGDVFIHQPFKFKITPDVNDNPAVQDSIFNIATTKAYCYNPEKEEFYIKDVIDSYWVNRDNISWITGLSESQKSFFTKNVFEFSKQFFPYTILNPNKLYSDVINIPLEIMDSGGITGSAFTINKDYSGPVIKYVVDNAPGGWKGNFGAMHGEYGVDTDDNGEVLSGFSAAYSLPSQLNSQNPPFSAKDIYTYYSDATESPTPENLAKKGAVGYTNWLKYGSWINSANDPIINEKPNSLLFYNSSNLGLGNDVFNSMYSYGTNPSVKFFPVWFFPQK